MNYHELRNLFPTSILRFFWAFPAGIRAVTVIILSQKIFLTLVAFLLPAFDHDNNSIPKWTAWDTEAYLAIAADGYEPGSPWCAFYPLWPASIKVGSWLMGGNAVLAAWIIGNIFSLIALVFFYRWISERHGEEKSRLATMLLLFYPGSIFLFTPYSESLFLLLLVACMFSLHRNFLPGVLCASFLLPMTRAIGIFILPVLAWELLAKRQQPKKLWS